MTDKVRVAVVGLGKMGISHFGMVNAHPDAETLACDGSGFMVDALTKNIATPIYKDYDTLLEKEPLDAVIIATPSRLHAPMVKAALDRDIHVFCEKPFCLDWGDSAALTDLAAEKGRVAQVGYHYRYVGAFQEMKRILDSGALGKVTHVLAEAYGPVVLRPKRATWRTQKEEGGGCLYDYAAHPLNLLNWYFGAPDQVMGSVLGQVFSEGTDDQVFSTLQWTDGPTAQLSVNWSDESHRKMSTKIAMIGTNGRLYADRQECQLFLRDPHDGLPGYEPGWTVKYTTELTDEVWFYLRGEEYSAQIADFVEAVRDGKSGAVENSFASATETDRTLAMIIENAETGQTVGEARAMQAPKKRGWFGRG
ncbi:NTD biosynthesis operon putative oxidoreductase NtdC (plasmid) [Rhodovulum sp. P5]|uniref:Gfo/Idh/MocA family protein n=1 Tax=Rhodovulum sp. P5 TaxID=1564506 RepID=UPI0009C1C067|nr:Gfo/Idh/MocA family oxidoreductase [Rhodovulum sp. P5]ARE42549.1 NTD biosynthesis operon putative oxidoreductase NtdC [Rhodovulum sp. P5]